MRFDHRTIALFEVLALATRRVECHSEDGSDHCTIITVGGETLRATGPEE